MDHKHGTCISKQKCIACIENDIYGHFYALAIQRMMEKEYSVTPVCLRPSSSASGVNNLRLSFSGRGIHVLWTHF